MLYCRRPFENFYITEDGRVHLCCPEWIDRHVGNLLEQKPMDIWHGKVAGQIRASILDGSFRHCHRCPLLPGPRGCVVEKTGKEHHDPDRVRIVTLGYDATCNLACPSCRTHRKGPTERAKRIQDSLLADGFFEHADILCAAGSGDPFASYLFWEMLEKLDQKKYYHLEISLQTNGQLMTPKNLERMGYWKNKIISALVSIDAATPLTYRLNRGGYFAHLLENLYFAREANIPLQINMVVQENNFQEMIDFVCLGESLGVYRVYFSALENWGTYSDNDYLERAVHLPGHKRHQELLEVLKDPIFQNRGTITLAGLPQ